MRQFVAQNPDLGASFLDMKTNPQRWFWITIGFETDPDPAF
jgi:hypothetical protein